MTAELRSPLTKEAGALKEHHEVELGLATPLDPLPERLGDLPIRVAIIPRGAYVAVLGFSAALVHGCEALTGQGPRTSLPEDAGAQGLEDVASRL